MLFCLVLLCVGVDGSSTARRRLAVCRTDLTSATQAYRIGKYAEDRQELEASLKRAKAMGLGLKAMMTIQETAYRPAELHLAVGNSSVDSDVVAALLDSTFVQNVVCYARGTT